jgi:hypothetical protein
LVAGEEARQQHDWPPVASRQARAAEHRVDEQAPEFEHPARVREVVAPPAGGFG